MVEINRWKKCLYIEDHSNEKPKKIFPKTQTKKEISSCGATMKNIMYHLKASLAKESYNEIQINKEIQILV